jgi:hypothetical protein
MTAITSALASARSSVTTTTSPGFEQKAAQVDNPELFELIFSIAASFKARASVSTWLLAIARYKALSARRRRTDVEWDDDLALSVADPADGPDLALEKKAWAELVRCPSSEILRQEAILV